MRWLKARLKIEENYCFSHCNALFCQELNNIYESNKTCSKQFKFRQKVAKRIKLQYFFNQCTSLFLIMIFVLTN